MIVLYILTALSKEGQRLQGPSGNSLEGPLEEAAPIGSYLGTWQAGRDWGMVTFTGTVQGEEGAAKVSHLPVSNVYLGPGGLWMSRVHVSSKGPVAPGLGSKSQGHFPQVRLVSRNSLGLLPREGPEVPGAL